MKLKKLLALATFAAVTASSQAAVVVTKDMSVTDAIPGLTGFQTTGAQMSGLKVTATFNDGFSQTLSWAATGASSGGVFGDIWSLTQSGDTFSSVWNFVMGTDHGQLVSFLLDASGPQQVTVFDTTSGAFGETAGSAAGKDFAFSFCNSCDVTATYSNAVAVIPGSATGDTFHTLLVTFDQGTGPRTDFSFVQDTDNDSRLITGFVPEPGTFPLMGLALLGMGAVLRRRRAV
jgi:hypothetical protein